jgi:transcriptional regulator GlxA family with amidase domain
MMHPTARFLFAAASRAALLAVALAAALPAPAALAQQEAPAQSGPSPSAGARPLTLGVVLYPGFELLDVFGPLEMFVNVGPGLLRVVMIAEEAGEVAASAGGAQGVAGPRAVADYGFADAPPLDILLVPGGFGTLRELNNQVMLDWLRERSAQAKLTTSVCSGSALLAKAGLLDGRRATSNKEFFSLIAAQGPNVQWVPKARWVEDGNFITSSGVSAGMDMALAVIARLFGEPVAESIARGTEYRWHRDPDDDPFARAPE